MGFLKPILPCRERPFPLSYLTMSVSALLKSEMSLGPPQEELDDADGLDLVALVTIRVNGVTQLMMMKGDVLSGIGQSKFVINTKQSKE